MKTDIVPLLALGCLFWSLWEFYSGNHQLAFYLLGVAIFIVLSLCLIFLYSIDTLTDLVEKSETHQTERLGEHFEAIHHRLDNLTDSIRKK